MAAEDWGDTKLDVDEAEVAESLRAGELWEDPHFAANDMSLYLVRPPHARAMHPLRHARLCSGRLRRCGCQSSRSRRPHVTPCPRPRVSHLLRVVVMPVTPVVVLPVSVCVARCRIWATRQSMPIRSRD